MKDDIALFLKINEAFLLKIPSMHGGNYLKSFKEYFKNLTGFDGSSGFVLIGKNACALFVDGRYTLQAKLQSPDFEIRSCGDFFSWLETNKIEKIFFDAQNHTISEIEKWRKSSILFEASNIIKIPQSNQEQNFNPSPYICKEQKKWNYVTPFFLTDVESVNWLLGIRGHEKYTPVSYALAVIHEKKIDVFIEYETCLPLDFVTWRPLKDIEEYLLRQNALHLDPSTTPYAFLKFLKNPIFTKDPSHLERACKTKEEQKKLKEIHAIDALAMQKFLRWIKEQDETTEIDAASQLELFRKENSFYQGPSFSTISGANEHGAVIHYRATKQTNKIIKAPCIYLCDSGGQYFDGTTDITRTIAIGTPTQEQKEMYTLVLKGHIALALAKFPKGTCGYQLDVLARQYLWGAAKDYAHGTGHGVGTFLCVHEGPQGISPYPNPTPLMPGMVVSNEPGFYKEGEYGIRIENLMLVVEVENNFLAFEMLSFVEMDKNLIIYDNLTQDEQNWLDWYHANVKKE
jgi:Xaa-Pro aminopeptidase